MNVTDAIEQAIAYIEELSECYCEDEAEKCFRCRTSDALMEARAQIKALQEALQQLVYAIEHMAEAGVDTAPYLGLGQAHRALEKARGK